LGKITRTFLLGSAGGAFEQKMTASRSATGNRVLVMVIFSWEFLDGPTLPSAGL